VKDFGKGAHPSGLREGESRGGFRKRSHIKDWVKSITSPPEEYEKERRADFRGVPVASADSTLSKTKAPRIPRKDKGGGEHTHKTRELQQLEGLKDRG